ncbi:hypothetical protein Tco_0027464 [Tanacetum coccineum]
MELEKSQNNVLAKLPMLKLREYEMWEIRIKQYFQIQDYALWEVIENGNSWVPIPVIAPESGPSTALKMTVPSTVEEKICKKNDVKARTRFGGNDATKKTQKALLKQRYENFNASSSESLDSIFNRLQKLVSRLAILGVVTPPEDLNVKFLRSLPFEWDTHVVVWMNKPDFDTMGLDDLYNNFKIVEQKVKRSAGTNNDDKNLAFLTTSCASSTNNINTVNPEVSTGTTKVNTASTETSTASFSDATVYAFLSTQPQGSQLVHEDLEQLHDDDLEEIDLKWNMALLSMGARKFVQRVGIKRLHDDLGDNTAKYSVLVDHLIRRIHQLDTTYQNFYPEQRTEFYSLNDISVLPNNTAYFVDSIRRNHLTRAMSDITTEFIIREILEKVVTNSNSKLTKTWVDLNELCKRIFKDLYYHAFSGMEEDDVVDHIANFLEILDPIKTEEHEYGNPPNDSFPKPYLNTNNARDKSYHKENNEDTNKSGDMVLSGAPHSEELTNGQLNEKVKKLRWKNSRNNTAFIQGGLWKISLKALNLDHKMRHLKIVDFLTNTSTLMAFGGNTCDLGSFGEETDEITDLHQDSPRRDENPISTLEDYSKPSHNGYRNTIELPVGNNVVTLRSDTIRLVQNGCSFHRLRSEDHNQHLKNFLKLVDSLDLDSDNRERTRVRLFQFSLRDQASTWLERLLAGSITTWEDLTA